MCETSQGKITKLRLAGCSGLALIAVIAGLGQTPTPLFEVSGVVLDPSGAAIPEAKIILRREGVRPEQARTTNQIGNFSSDLFGLPAAARPARRMQLKFGFEF